MFRPTADALTMMEETETADRVERLLEAPIGQAGYRLLEVQFRHEGRWVLRLIVDREPAISMDGLTDVNELAGRLLDVEDPIPQAYSLEISSPGLFRPLREIKHFRQSVGKWAKLTLAPDAPNAPNTLGGGKKRQLRGVISAVEGETVHLECEGKRISLAKDEIQVAKLDPDL
ncbi:MAG: ribosome maturation factor RimP [bacterium]